jgi:hypothetical protein
MKMTRAPSMLPGAPVDAAFCCEAAERLVCPGKAWSLAAHQPEHRPVTIGPVGSDLKYAYSASAGL